jgi:hypothetical protein
MRKILLPTQDVTLRILKIPDRFFHHFGAFFAITQSAHNQKDTVGEHKPCWNDTH